MAIYGVVSRYTRGHSVVMLWIHKSISRKIEHYKFLNDRIIETKPHTRGGNLTILGVLSATEGREELSEYCYERYRKYWTK